MVLLRCLQNLATKLAKCREEISWIQLARQTLKLYQEGKLVEGVIVAEQALDKARSLHNGDHPNVATSLNDLAALYYSQGRYEEAEPKHLEALAMTKRLFKGDHPDVIKSLNNLVALYYSQKRYSQAEPLSQEALAMTQRLKQGARLDVAQSLNNLAALYYSQGRYEEAEPLYRKALEMRQRLFKGDHPDVTESLNNLACLYDSQGRYELAEPLYREALEMRQRLFQGDHPDVATYLNNLAAFYHSQRLYSQAEPLYRKALEMIQRLFEGDHPHVALSLNNLATLLAATNSPSEALALMQQATEVEDRIIRRVFAASSERDRLGYLQTIRSTLEGLLSLVWKYLRNSPEAVQTALDVVLKRKSLTASALAALNEALYSDRYPHLAEEFQKLRSLSAEIVHLTFSPPLPDPNITPEQFRAQQTAHQQRLSQLQAEYDNLEKRLASQVPEIQLQEQPSDRRAVALELPEGSALVEFVRFRVFDFTAYEWQPARYAAFVLPSREPDSVQMIDLGEAEHIDLLILEFRALFARDTGDSLGMIPPKPGDRNQPAPAAINLWEFIYKPIRKVISKYRHLLLAPDGDLNLVPFQILPLDETGKRLLMDEYTISYLSVGRDVMRGKLPRKRPTLHALILADPDYNLGAELAADFVTDETDGKDADVIPASASKSLSENEVQRLNRLTGSSFERAEGTDFLGKSVAEKLKVPPYLQAEALESHLTSGRCPSILLIATHGHFAQLQKPYRDLIIALLNCPSGQEGEILEQNRALVNEELLVQMEEVAISLEDKNPNPANWLRNFAPQVRELIENSAPKPPQLPIRMGEFGSFDRFSAAKVENPMMRSVLALAGANTWIKGGTLPPEAGKGFLFAQDVAVIDLWGNELTVLSACNTAIGDIKTGEGVFGMRRAFAIAGSKTLVMSLWDVPARASALLMSRFFDNLQDGLGRADALQLAQNYIRTITVGELQQSDLGRQVLEELVQVNQLNLESLISNLEKKPLAHPLYWGAWVCQGDTTPLN